MSNPLLSLIDIDYPLIQAPMAGVSTPALAAAVSHAGWRWARWGWVLQPLPRRKR